MLSKGWLVHRTPDRLRIRISSKQRDGAYFSQLQDQFSGMGHLERIETNELTGSVLLAGGNIDVEHIADYARENGLFELQTLKQNPAAAFHAVSNPIKDVSHSIHRFTGGQLDLQSLSFLALLSAGVYQILRGNFGAPPWYTAFWYALGVFSRSAVD